MNDNLLFELETLIEAYEEEAKHKLNSKEREYLQTKLYTFVHAGIPKYIKGSKEHDSDLPTMTAEKLAEMRGEEIVDLWFYN